MALDATGAVAGEQRYYPFGATRVATGAMGTDRLFTGQRAVAELGLYHFNARFYSATLGRFLSADTIVPQWTNPQSLNRYSYTRNNPLRYTDPSGHSVECGLGELYCKAGRLDTRQRATDLANRYQRRATRTPTTTYFGGLSSQEKLILGEGGWTEGVFNDHVAGNATNIGNRDVKPCYDALSSLGCFAFWSIPSHAGARIQGELGGNIPALGPTGPGINVAVGAQFLSNRVSGQSGANIDWSLEWTWGAPGWGGGVTFGPLVGWASSDLDQIVTGNSAILGGSAFVGGLGASGALTIVPDIDNISRQNPFTAYLGAGLGGPFAIGVGGGWPTKHRVTGGSFVIIGGSFRP